MHPRNIYRRAPDFKELAIAYPEFRQFTKVDLSGHVRFDFQKPEALAQLTKTLLLKDFNLSVEIPADKLVPTLPLRLNYILWIEDLLNYLNVNNCQISGIDIGTGASCVFALLAAKKGWKMLATEINSSSAEIARGNVEKNGLSEFINVKEVSDSNLILKEVIEQNNKYHFSMCNPPFFIPNEEPEQRTERRNPPRNAPTGSPAELKTEGGEVAFISKMIDDSMDLKENVLIYTSMVGKRSSLKVLQKKLLGQVKAVSITPFHQGRTTRWGLAWSFSVDLPKLREKNKKSKEPISYKITDGSNVGTVVERVKTLLTGLKMKLEEINNQPHKFRATAIENTWAHQRRKRRQQQRQEGSPPEKKAKMGETGASAEVILEFNINVRQSKDAVLIECLWQSGPAGKDGLYQVIQYIKNNWVAKNQTKE